MPELHSRHIRQGTQPFKNDLLKKNEISYAPPFPKKAALFEAFWEKLHPKLLVVTCCQEWHSLRLSAAAT